MAKQIYKHTFDIVLWDETGNVLLFKKRVSANRTCVYIAQDYVKTKYPQPYFVECWNTEKIVKKIRLVA
jgi:hypothetical protein